jgi:hypothetical protein
LFADLLSTQHGLTDELAGIIRLMCWFVAAAATAACVEPRAWPAGLALLVLVLISIVAPGSYFFCAGAALVALFGNQIVILCSRRTTALPSRVVLDG